MPSTSLGELIVIDQNTSILLRFNFSLDDAAREIERYSSNDRMFDEATETIVVLIVSGMVSNFIVSGAVLTKTKICSTHFAYVVNLNVSDLVFCMPFSLMTLVKRRWILGLTLCKLVPFVQAANVFGDHQRDRGQQAQERGQQVSVRWAEARRQTDHSQHRRCLDHFLCCIESHTVLSDCEERGATTRLRKMSRGMAVGQCKRFVHSHDRFGAIPRTYFGVGNHSPELRHRSVQQIDQKTQRRQAPEGKTKESKSNPSPSDDINSFQCHLVAVEYI